METIIITIITFILGYITGIYLPIKFRKEDKTPKISVSPFQERQNHFEITNHGGDILNMNITIFWLQDGKNQERKMDDFFDSDKDPAIDYPKKCNSLKKGETKKVTGCPVYSDNGEVKILINGINVDKKKYTKEIILKNNIKK